jgi:hypothetical protein
MRTKKDDIKEKLESLKQKLFATQDKIHEVEKELAAWDRDQKWANETGAAALKFCDLDHTHVWNVVTLRRDIEHDPPVFSWQEDRSFHRGYSPGRVSTNVEYECTKCYAKLTLAGSKY